MTTSHSLADLSGYLFICSVAVICGLGVIRLLCVPLALRTSLLLAPVATQALWALLLGMGVVSGIPVRQLAMPVWVVTAVFALYGVWMLVVGTPRALDGHDSRRSACIVLVLCALLPLVLLLPDSLSGLSTYGGYGSDGWAYIANSRYLWQFSKGTEGGLAPLYQWASHLSATRYVGSAELGLLSMLHSPGDTQAVDGLLVALVLFSMAAAYGAFACSFGLSTVHVASYVGLSMLSGWMLNVILADNNDFAVALAYFAAMAAVVRDSRPFTATRWGFMACLCAGVFYTYPELAPVIVACTAPMVIERLWNEPLRAWRGLLPAFVVLALLVSPYLQGSLRFVQSQSAFALRGAQRPGEGYLPGLLIPAQQVSAFWGLGGELGAQRLPVLQLAFGVALSLLTLAGLVRLIRLGAWSIAVIVVALLCGTATFLLHYTYAYGAYKFLLLDWWLLTFVVLLGATWPIVAMRSRVRRMALCAAAIVVTLAIPGALAIRLVRNSPLRAQRAVERFQPVEQVRWLTGGSPVGVSVQDPFASYWAVYFLRDQPIRLLEFPGYLGMPHVRPLLARAPDIPAQSIRFLLTDAVDPGPMIEDEGWKLIWQSGPYRLWDTQSSGWAIAQEVQTPNGFEVVDGQPFFWMGAGATSLDITASRAGAARLEARFDPGPNLPRGTSTVHVRVANSIGIERLALIAPGTQTICLPVSPGTTTWRLTSLEPVVMPARPTADTRTLVLGVWAPRILWTAAPFAHDDGC